MSLGRTQVLGVPLTPITRDGAGEAVMALIEAGRPTYLVTANLHYAMLTAEHPELRAVNEGAAMVFADGAPLVWASRRGPTPVPERVAGSDMILDLCALAAGRGKSVYLLGAAEGVAAEAARRLVERFPGLEVAGTSCPSPRDMVGEGVARVIAEVKAAAPDLLMIAMTMPRGEIWLAEHHQALGVPVSVNLGASLDFVAGRVRRAPRLIQSLGMEWAFRMYLEPARMAPRYARNARFLVASLAQDLLGQGRRGRALP